MEPWWFPYTMPVVLSFQLLRLKIFKGLLLSLRHVLKFSFAAVSLLGQEFTLLYLLFDFALFFSSLLLPLLLIKVRQASRDGHVGFVLSPLDTLQQGGVPSHKLVKHVL